MRSPKGFEGGGRRGLSESERRSGEGRGGGSTRLPDQRGWKRRRRFLLWLKSLKGTDEGVTGSPGTTAVQSAP